MFWISAGKLVKKLILPSTLVLPVKLTSNEYVSPVHDMLQVPAVKLGILVHSSLNPTVVESTFAIVWIDQDGPAS